MQASMPRASLRSVLVAIGTFILGFALHAVSRPLFDAAVRDVGTSSPLDALFVNSVRVKQLNPTSNLGAGAAFQYNTMHRERSSTETAVIPAAAEGRFQQDAYAAAQTTRVCAFGSGLVKKCEKVCVVPSCPVSNAKPNGEEVSHKQRCAMRMDGCCEFTCVDDEIRVRPVDASTVPLSSHSCYGAGRPPPAPLAQRRCACRCARPGCLLRRALIDTTSPAPRTRSFSARAAAPMERLDHRSASTRGGRITARLFARLADWQRAEDEITLRKRLVRRRGHRD